MTTEHPSAGRAQDEVLRLAHALDGGKLINDSTEWADTLHAAAAELRRLHARVQELERDKERLDSGCILTDERDEFGDEYQCARRGLDLRAAIDAAIRARGAQGENA